MEKWGILGLKRPKKHGFDWQQGYGGGALVKAPKQKWGKIVLLSFPITPGPQIFAHALRALPNVNGNHIARHSLTGT